MQTESQSAAKKPAPAGGYQDYGFAHAGASHMHCHFMPLVFALSGGAAAGTRVLDIGCGNGYTAGQFLQHGCEVVGIDLSEKGIEIARATYPQGRFEVLAADDSVLEKLRCDPFDLIVSTEVIEHLYSPRPFVAGCFDALRPGGRLVLSTPYHGFVKNLALSLANKWDSHANPLWDGGHIKLWSRRTLATLLLEAGFIDLEFRGAGRFPWCWMTMVMGATKPPK